MRLASAIPAALVGIAPAIGLAQTCLSEAGVPSRAAVRGAACEMYYQTDTHTRTGLGQAQHSGGRYVWQSAYQTDGCRGETHFVLMDCATREAIVLGTVRFTPDTRPFLFLERMGDDFAARLERGEGDLLETARTRAREIGLTDVVRVRTNGRIALNGQVLGLGCACKGLSGQGLSVN